ncbi:MAG TPA: hypothetical protein VD999_04675 [Vitreimonas sp.]|nr:hypothetical protein [Vitreimonas sp.]
MKKETLLWLGLWVVAVVMRFWQLGSIPATVVHDEIIYAAQAQSIAVSGSDLTGTWRPWHFRPAHILYAELPATVMAPAAVIISDPLVAARAAQAIIGSLLPFILAGLSYHLFKNKSVALTTAVLAVLNPWLFQFSRLSFDAIFSLFFYFSGIYVWLAAPKWHKLWALPLLILGFFQYQGLKIIFPALIAITLVYDCREAITAISIKKLSWNKLKTQLSNYLPDLLIVLCCAAIFLWYIANLASQSASQRVGDMIFFNEDYVSSLVNEERRLSLVSPLNTLFSNKATVIGYQLLLKYARAFEPYHLFLTGENVRNPFSVWTAGIFYPIDILLIGAGLFYVWHVTKWRPQAYFITALILIAPLPSAVNSLDSWIMFRSSFLFPLLIMLAALGLELLRNHKKLWLFAGIVLIYSGCVVWFQYQYWVRYPIISTKGSALAERVVNNYVARVQKDHPQHRFIVLGDESEFRFNSYLFFNRLITADNMPAIQQTMSDHSYQLGNVRFVTDCIDLTQLNDTTTIISEASNTFCNSGTKADVPTAISVTNIPSLFDSGAIYKVYNDQLCSTETMQGFSQITDLKHLQVEKLDTPEFCRALLTKD